MEHCVLNLLDYTMRIFRLHYSDIQATLRGYSGYAMRIFRLHYEDIQATLRGYSGYTTRIFRLHYKDIQATLRGYSGYTKRYSIFMLDNKVYRLSLRGRFFSISY